MENETFWISFISICSGLFVVSLKYCLKSKCDTVECFCFKLHRNTEQELSAENESDCIKGTVGLDRMNNI